MLEQGVARRLSIIVPAYNEAANMALLEAELSPVALELGAEILVVDDGSTDGTADRVPSTAPFRCLRVEHGGKTSALQAGFDATDSDLLVTIDADLQEDPGALPGLVELLASHDCVLGIRADRTDSFLRKRLPSRIYNALIHAMFGRRFADINCGCRGFRREALRHLRFYDGAHRTFPLMIHIGGGKVGLIPVRHRARRFEAAKFSSPSRFLPALVELMRLRRELR